MAKEKQFSWITIIISSLYLLVHFVPDMGRGRNRGAMGFYFMQLMQRRP